MAKALGTKVVRDRLGTPYMRYKIEKVTLRPSGRVNYAIKKMVMGSKYHGTSRGEWWPHSIHSTLADARAELRQIPSKTDFTRTSLSSRSA